MSGWLIAAAYIFGWFVAAVKVTRLVMTFPRCSGKGTHRWGWSSGPCRRYDPSDCWTRRETPELADVTIGAAAALIWPVSLLMGAVYLAARRPQSSPRLMSEAELDRLERDLGIGDVR